MLAIPLQKRDTHDETVLTSILKNENGPDWPLPDCFDPLPVEDLRITIEFSAAGCPELGRVK